MADAIVTVKVNATEFDTIMVALELHVLTMQNTRNQMKPCREKTELTGEISEAIKLVNSLKGTTHLKGQEQIRGRIREYG